MLNKGINIFIHSQKANIFPRDHGEMNGGKINAFVILNTNGISKILEPYRRWKAIPGQTAYHTFIR